MPLQERVLRLQQLPDKQGILISAGKQHLGNLAMTLHVSVLISQQYKVAVMVSIMQLSRSAASIVGRVEQQ